MTSNHPDYYASNFSLLEIHHPQVAAVLKALPPEPSGRIWFSDSGKPNLQVADADGLPINLHDTGDPEAEARDFLKMVPEGSTGFVMLMGMGLGYTPLALLRERPTIRNLVVFELEPENFQQALTANDLSAMLTDPRLVLCVSPDPDVDAVLAPMARAMQLEAIHTLSHLPSMRIRPAAYETLSRKLFASANEYNVRASTVFAFGRSFLANRFSHLTSIQHHYLLEGMQGAFSGIPAILVAGGPSLDKNIHMIEKAKEKAVIISVDTVLPALLSRGITPDFVTAIDPEEFTYEKYARVIPEIDKTALICTAWVTPKVPKTYPNRRVLWTFTGNGVESWMNGLFGGNLLTGGANTVAQLSFVSATILGCSPIIFVGQDLAFSGEKDHAADTVLSNQDMLDDLIKNGKDLIWVDGNEGGKVPTNRSFYSMIRSFEKMIGGTPGHYINATEGGARIEGTEILTLAEAIERHCKQPQAISDQIDVFFSQNPPISVERMLHEFREGRKRIKNLFKTIRKSDKLAREARKMLARAKKNDRAYRSADALPKAFQQLLNEIDACHQKLDNAVGFWRVLEEITLEGLRQSERQRHAIELLAKEPDRFLEWIEKNLDRLDGINRVRASVLQEFGSHIDKIIAYHETSEMLVEKTSDSDASPDDYLALLAFYSRHGQLALMEPVLEGIEKNAAQTPEVLFYKGCIAAHRAEYGAAEAAFRKVLHDDPGFADKVDAFRLEMGEQYYQYAMRLKKDGYDIRKMLLKGACYGTAHTGVNAELSAVAEKDLKAVVAAYENGDFENARNKLNAWRESLRENDNLHQCVPAATLAELCRYQGHLLVKDGAFADAAGFFRKASESQPESADLFIYQADAHFAIQHFEDGIQALHKAVALDRRYAVYWETIGDNLRQAGQPADALIAYENCYTALPERLPVLKKIGDCYMAMDQPHAAKAAYAQVKSQYEKSVSAA